MTFLSNLLHQLERLGKSLVGHHSLEIVDEGPNRLELETNAGNFVFDRRRQVVSRNGKEVAQFRQVKSVDVTRDKERGESTYWRISLYLNPIHRIRIGKTRDDVQASIVGSRIIGIMGVKGLGWKESHDLPR